MRERVGQPNDLAADGPPSCVLVLGGGEVEDGCSRGSGAQGEEGHAAGLVHRTEVVEERGGG